VAASRSSEEFGMRRPLLTAHHSKTSTERDTWCNSVRDTIKQTLHCSSPWNRGSPSCEVYETATKQWEKKAKQANEAQAKLNQQRSDDALSHFDSLPTLQKYEQAMAPIWYMREVAHIPRTVAMPVCYV